MSTAIVYTRSNTSTDTYEPFMVADKQAGEVHWLTQENSSGDPAYSGLWRCQPMTFAYEFPGDEIFQVLHGELTIEVQDGDTIELKEGDLISFDKGVKSIWTIKSSFKKFFVISNC